jgi:N-hydroxyarylamine O-acetyltransferase
MLNVDGYLRRLGLDRAVAGPSTEGLFALHRAHVSRVPYENLEIQLGRVTTVDPQASAARIIAGRGGYCYHLNGAFALLLETLGYDVTRHLGGVFNQTRTPPGADGGHVALTVRVEGAEWFVDAGLGDALHEPMPLRAGMFRQGPFVYQLEPSPIVAGGWRFWHDPEVSSFAGMDFAPEPVTMDAFVGMHQWLSTAAKSPFVAIAQVGRRTEAGLDFVQGCYLRTFADGALHKQVLTSQDEWFGVISDVFGLPLADVDATARAALWQRMWTAHERYVASLSNTAPV